VLAGGLYWKRASSTGATLALLSGLTAIAGLGPVQEQLGVQWKSSIVGLTTVLLAVAAMVLGSLFFPDRAKEDRA
jgi:SSS family solute:Na+ symporter